MTSQRWEFYIDRGGTFTDVVAKTHRGEIIVHKLLSENPEQYQDAPIQGIRDLMGIAQNEPIPTAQIEVVKMGTTVATNALLERKGDRVVLLITKGFKRPCGSAIKTVPIFLPVKSCFPVCFMSQLLK